MPSLLLRQREQRDVFAREALDLPSRHHNCQAPVDGIDDGDGLEVTVPDERGHYLIGGREPVLDLEAGETAGFPRLSGHRSH